MSYPNIIYGDYGDEKKVSSAAVLPLGTKMVLPDGRVFRYSKEAATAAVAGKVYVSEAPVATDGNAAGTTLTTLAAQTIVVGSTTIIMTQMGGTTAITKDQYAGGYMTFQAGTAGIGHMYRIKNNTATASTAAVTCTITLEPSDAIAATIACGTTKVGLLQNPFKNLILRAAASTAVGAVAGVWPVAVPASSCGWIQRHGQAAVLTGATALILGAPVIASTATAGAVITQATAATASVTNDNAVIGWAMNTVTAAEYANVYLTLE